MMYGPTATTHEGLSGLPESTFALRIGTAPAYASTLTEAKKMVYVRANYNRNLAAHGGSLPNVPTKFYSDKLVGDVMDAYRTLAGTGTVKHITTETVATTAATDTYNQVTSRLLTTYPGITVDVARTIMREWLYATVDGKVKAELLLPAAQRYPTAGALAMLANDEARREINEEKESLSKETFFGKIGASIANLLAAPGELASAATTTAKVAGVGVVVLGVGVVGTIVWTVASKIRQLDVNNVVNQGHETIRQVGPEAANLALTRGVR